MRWQNNVRVLPLGRFGKQDMQRRQYLSAADVREAKRFLQDLLVLQTLLLLRWEAWNPSAPQTHSLMQKIKNTVNNLINLQIIGFSDETNKKKQAPHTKFCICSFCNFHFFTQVCESNLYIQCMYMFKWRYVISILTTKIKKILKRDEQLKKGCEMLLLFWSNFRANLKKKYIFENNILQL